LKVLLTLNIGLVCSKETRSNTNLVIEIRS